MSDELIVNDKQAMSALKKHGGNIVWAIILVLASYFGWQFYQKNYAKIDTAGADSYTNISTKAENLAILTQNPDAKAQADSEKTALFADIDNLASQHGDTVYAWQGLMTKARLQADGDDYKGAIETLNKAIAVPIDDKGLLAISRLELAQVQLANGETDTALATIKGEFPISFEASRLEIEGDILLAKKDNDGAKAVYQKAWDLLAERHENRALLKLKMQSLGLTPSEITPKYQVVADSQSSAAAGQIGEIAQEGGQNTAQQVAQETETATGNAETPDANKTANTKGDDKTE